MVSNQLHRRTTRYAPLLCWVLAMGGADASDFTDSFSPWAPKRVVRHRSGHVLVIERWAR